MKPLRLLALSAAVSLTGCGGGPSGAAIPDPAIRSRDAAAGRATRYLIPKFGIFRTLSDAVLRRYALEREIRSRSYLLSQWLQRIEAGREPDRIRVEAEVLGPDQGPCRLRIRVERQIKEVSTGRWTPAGWDIEEEDALYSEVHRRLTGS